MHNKGVMIEEGDFIMPKENGFASFTPKEAKENMKRENHNGSTGKITTEKEVQRTINNK